MTRFPVRPSKRAAFCERVVLGRWVHDWLGIFAPPNPHGTLPPAGMSEPVTVRHRTRNGRGIVGQLRARR